MTNGTCIRTSASELPWCFVVEDTCITPVLHRNGLGKNDSAWDTCLNTGESLLLGSFLALPAAWFVSIACTGCSVGGWERTLVFRRYAWNAVNGT